MNVSSLKMAALTAFVTGVLGLGGCLLLGCASTGDYSGGITYLDNGDIHGRLSGEVVVEVVNPVTTIKAVIDGVVSVFTPPGE